MSSRTKAMHQRAWQASVEARLDAVDEAIEPLKQAQKPTPLPQGNET